jgi:hypothetical protein
MTEDLVTKFVEDSRKEKGNRVSATLRKEEGDAGFCLKVRGGKKAVDAFVKAMNEIDLGEHQQ